MKFRTEYKVERASFSLNPEKPVVLLGSCFADNICRSMRQCLWNASNPLGTLYNPLSIERSVVMCLYADNPTSAFENTLFEDGGLWHSWMSDSSWSSSFRGQCIDSFLKAREDLCCGLDNAEALFVTLGTSWCWYLSDDTDFVVANCHKQPSSKFVRRRLTVNDIVVIWESLSKRLKECYPQLNIVFTVSPVRHLKEGFVGNARSKAVLQLGVEELCRRLDFCHYFPAYEILNDDLRDYRFYASDLAHPSEEAVEYIWNIFQSTYLDSEGMSLLKEGERLARYYHHRPLIDECRQDERLRQRYYEEKLKAEQSCKNFLSCHPGMLSPFNC